MLNIKLANGQATITLTVDVSAWDSQLKNDVASNVRTPTEARDKMREVILSAAEEAWHEARRAYSQNPDAERAKLEVELARLAGKTPDFDASVKV